MEVLVKEVSIWLITGLISVILWFMRGKDDSQEKKIALLFVKHDEDVKALSELRERIAREHYVKAELDARFQRLEDAFRAGFHEVTTETKELGYKLDKLTEVIIQHIAKGN